MVSGGSGERDDQALANQGRLLVGGNTYILKAEPELAV